MKEVLPVVSLGVQLECVECHTLERAFCDPPHAEHIQCR